MSKQNVNLDDNFTKKIKKSVRYVSDFDEMMKKAYKTMSEFDTKKNHIKKSKEELEEIRKTVEQIDKMKSDIKVNIKLGVDKIKDIKPIKIPIEIKNSIKQDVKQDYDKLKKSFNNNKAVKFTKSIPKKVEGLKESAPVKLMRKPMDIGKKVVKKAVIYTLNNDKMLKKIADSKKAMNELKKNVAITIAAKNVAKDSIGRIKNNLKEITKKPFNAVIKAKDQTKNVIDKIKNSLSSLKKVVLGDTSKKIFDWSIGSSIKGEERFSNFKTSFKNENSANEAFEWANNQSSKTQFTSEETTGFVSKMASSGLDYKKYFTSLGDFSTANNKSMDSSIEAMAKLSKGNTKDGVNDLMKLGITKDMWAKQGIKINKDGSTKSSSSDLMSAASKIMDSNGKGSMLNKSNTASGQIKNIKGTFSSLGTNLVGLKDNGEIVKGGVFDTFKKQLSTILPLLEKFKKSDAFKKIQKDLSALVAAGGSKFTSFINGLMKNPQKVSKAFDKLGKGIKSFISTVIKIGSAIKGITKALSPLFSAISKHPKAFLALFAVLKVGVPIISGVIGAFRKFDEIKKDIGILKTAIKIFSTSAKSSFLSLFKVISISPVTLIILAIIAVVFLLYKAWTENWGGIRDKAKVVMEFLAEKFNTFMVTMGKLKDGFVSFCKAIVENFGKVKEFFADPIGATLRIFKENVSSKGYEENPRKKVDGNALGTSYWKGGWTWVGEHGPELMKLPSGAKILDNRTANNMCGGGFSMEKLADTLVIREDADIDRIANALAKKLENTSYNMA